MSGCWTSKADVVADLRRAGGRARLVPDLDDASFVYGERPPPPRAATDEGMEMMACGAGGVEGQTGAVGAVGGAPDLRGIASMLRMVKESQSAAGGGDGEPAGPADLLQLSKLNPHVREFVPGDPAVPAERGPAARDHTEVNETSLENESKQSPGQAPVADVTSDQTQIERKELAAMLKNKICSASHDESFEFKRQKNAAIANLLKLYATPAPPAAPAPAVRLCTPDYFARAAAAAPAPPPAAPAFSLVDHDDEEAAPADDGDVRESVAKVQSWLSGSPHSPRSPPRAALFLGPVAYKRRQRAPPPAATPPPPAPAPPPPPPPAAAPAYVPSELAAQLGRLYAERRAAAAQPPSRPSPPPPAMLWDRLEEPLRRRDEEVRARARTTAVTAVTAVTAAPTSHS